MGVSVDAFAKVLRRYEELDEGAELPTQRSQRMISLEGVKLTPEQQRVVDKMEALHPGVTEDKMIVLQARGDVSSDDAEIADATERAELLLAFSPDVYDNAYAKMHAVTERADPDSKLAIGGFAYGRMDLGGVGGQLYLEKPLYLRKGDIEIGVRLSGGGDLGLDRLTHTQDYNDIKSTRSVITGKPVEGGGSMSLYLSKSLDNNDRIRLSGNVGLSGAYNATHGTWSLSNNAGVSGTGSYFDRSLLLGGTAGADMRFMLTSKDHSVRPYIGFGVSATRSGSVMRDRELHENGTSLTTDEGTRRSVEKAIDSITRDRTAAYRIGVTFGMDL